MATELRGFFGCVELTNTSGRWHWFVNNYRGDAYSGDDGLPRWMRYVRRYGRSRNEMLNNANTDLCRNGLHDWEANKVWRSGQWWCDPCRRATARRWARENPPEKTAERRRLAAAAARESGRKYPDKVRARSAVRRAVLSGKITRPDHCTKCYKECVPEGSHDDYGKPLEVEWLCRQCHAAKDRGMHVRPAI